MNLVVDNWNRKMGGQHTDGSVPLVVFKLSLGPCSQISIGGDNHNTLKSEQRQTYRGIANTMVPFRGAGTLTTNMSISLIGQFRENKEKVPLHQRGLFPMLFSNPLLKKDHFHTTCESEVLPAYFEQWAQERDKPSRE